MSKKKSSWKVNGRRGDTYKTPRRVVKFIERELARAGEVFDAECCTGGFLALANPPFTFANKRTNKGVNQ